MSVYVGESRGELLAWLNDLLAPTVVTKLEQCGTGSVYCQIIDSIYGDLPMSRVKFNARMEYEYLDNFKILQKAFTRHKIEKPIPVDRLIKCKMQDNLEFLQWMKKYWDMHSRGEGYDAQARAGGHIAGVTTSSSRPTAARTRPAHVGGSAAGSRSVSSAGQANSAQVAAMQARVAEIEAHSEGLLKERDFYFDKLRNIELIVQERLAVEGIAPEESDVMTKIQDILYATIEGFEVPQEEDFVEEQPVEGEEETF
ncbi:RP/EB family microtubule-associated protein [Cryptococcus deuterogattii 99/473]|uniref:RP/EB family microtubule-associated protein n=1 Tax=Cryptococcus deuterogattii Ram5 TaxID=1296110 RepID=A0A0D0TTT5_9TREE|nr:RP/EB family microtubule-associated protein [Cryptococcus deuterogattii Ram5]KIS00860.1 RP/EB family microtubule-associated protein [Cryptococcus deuterogattii 2001/935-1]KIY57569.1 RP/EB family microtubule-associated protein [Cryptococcus deuterogattii 99/473]